MGTVLWILTAMIGVVVFSNKPIRQKLFESFQEKKLLPAPSSISLRGLEIGVYVRENNGSRTPLEHLIEQHLINLGATVRLANQERGRNFLKTGELDLLADGTNASFVGTLVKTTEDSSYWEKLVFFKFSFRLLGRDGAVLASGVVTNSEILDRISAASEDFYSKDFSRGSLHEIAEQAVSYIGEEVWSSVSLVLTDKHLD